MASVSQSDLLIFTNQFSAMIRSHLPLVDVLTNLAKETPTHKRALRHSLEEVISAVERGVDFADAIERHPRVFNNAYVNIVRAGLASGNLGRSLEQLGVYLDKSHEARHKLRSALTYPFMILFAFFLVFNGMIYFVLPNFDSLFEQFGGDLPWATQVLIAIGEWWKANAVMLLIATAGFAALMIFLLSNRGTRLHWDRWVMAIPLMGNLIRIAALSRFARTFAVQAENRVPILEALPFAGSASGNLHVEEVVNSVAGRIENGSSLHGAFEPEPVFQGIVLQMISSGEETGEIEHLLLSAANYFEKLLDNEIHFWTTLINPAMTLLVGVLASAMVIAAFLPIFQITNVMSRGM